MSNVDLNIVLKLLDEASDQIKKSLGDVTEETKKVGLKVRNQPESRQRPVRRSQ
jgi:hypothetical protein